MNENIEFGLSVTPRILRLPAVRRRTGLSRSSIYLRISQGRFPKQISLGERAVGWVESEVNEWAEPADRSPAERLGLKREGRDRWPLT